MIDIGTFYFICRVAYGNGRQTKDTNIAALDDGNGTMKSLDSEKAELLNDYFADIREDLAKNFVERAISQE